LAFKYSMCGSVRYEMPLGITKPDHRVNVGDTAELMRHLYRDDETAVPAADIAQVRITVQRPDKSQTTASATIETDGSGFYRWTDTTQQGLYSYVMQFTFVTGEIRSVRGAFEVIDPFNPPTLTPTEALSEAVWQKFEDCFDSNEGGPHLRDETLNYFNKDKVPQFIDAGVLLINSTPPVTQLVIGDFATVLPDGASDPDLPILAEAVFLEMVRHLMRSYVEQPLPQGAQVVYEDRRDYLQRWQMIYQMEMEYFLRTLALWKRQFIQLGHSKILVTAKAGRLLPAPLRSRNIGRGGLY
jgi:hypothetical protein